MGDGFVVWCKVRTRPLEALMRRSATESVCSRRHFREETFENAFHKLQPLRPLRLNSGQNAVSGKCPSLTRVV